MMALLVPRQGPPLPPWALLLIPLVFLAISWFSNRLMGIEALYRDWPADPQDPIERNLGWQQVEFGAFRGHSPMSLKVGRSCLHLKQPFPFQLFWWKGPASIPWTEIRLEKAPKEAWWALLSAAEFRLGREGRLIRLRGKAARTLATEVTLRCGDAGSGAGHSPVPPLVGPGPIRPR